MSSIEKLLRHLSRPEVSELALGTGRAPAVKLGSAYRAVAPETLSSAQILQLMEDAGATGALQLTDKPMQWSLQSEGVGAVVLAAVKRGDVVQARFSQVKGGAAAAPPAAATPASAPAAPPAAGSYAAAASSAAKGSYAAAAAAASSTSFVYTPPSPSSPPPAAVEASPRPVRRASSKDEVFGNLETLLESARQRQASDLHLISGRPALFRVAGELAPTGDVISHESVDKMILEHVPDRLRAQLEKEGSCDFALEHPTAGRFRVNVGRQRTGIKACLRVISKEIPTLASLGLPESIAQATHHHQGLIILTGPSGQGKTSTLAAIVDIINRDTNHHVITVEDPVEYVHPRKKAMMSQREVGKHTRSFQSALKGSLREDPDVIVVGELRDTETVRMALSAGETGHLLISTMNTPNAAKTIDRLIDLFPPADQGQVRMSLSSGLRLIVSQRLVPNVDGTGMVAAAELLPGSTGLANLIRDEKTYQIPSLQQRGKSMGIIRMDDSLAELVHLGKVTMETASLYAESPDELKILVNALKAPPPPALDAKKTESKFATKVMGNIMGRKGT